MLALILSLAIVASQAPQRPAAPQAPQPVTESMRADAKGRPVVSATIDGKGPFDVIVDTGAGSSVMMADLARTLALAPADETVSVSGVAAGEAARLYRVKSFSSRLFDLRDATIPAVSSIGATQAKIIAGIDLFENRRLTIDVVRGQMHVGPSGPPPAGVVAVKGEYVRGRGLLVPITINGVAIRGLVDTGAEGSVAGTDVLRAMGWEGDDPRLAAYGQIRGATGGGSTAVMGIMDTVRLGPVTARGMRIVFADSLGGGGAADGGAPIMVIGLDLLNALKTYALDLPRAELQMPGAPVAAAR